MPPSETERRRSGRRTPQPDEALSRVRLRTGRELTVVNISADGALVEGHTRLLPGTRTDVHIVTRHGRVLVRTRIVRSLVWRLEPDLVTYRTGLAFDVAVDTEVGEALSERRESNGYVVPAEIAGNGEGRGKPYPADIIGNRPEAGNGPTRHL